MEAITGKKSNKFLICLTTAIACVALAVLVFHDRRTAPTINIKELAELEDLSSAAWDGKSICLEGFWHGPFEGIAISTEPSSSAGKQLLMKPSPEFGVHESLLVRIVPFALRPDGIRVHHGDYVRILGFYHSTGYGDPGELLSSCRWVEFCDLEVWDQERKLWRSVDSLW